MDLVMCTACGNFVTAIPKETDEGEEKTLEPRVDACPECDGTDFKTTF